MFNWKVNLIIKNSFHDLPLKHNLIFQKHFFCNIRLQIYLFKMQNHRVRKILNPLVHSNNYHSLGRRQARARSQKLYLSLLHMSRGPITWAFLCYFPRCVRKLEHNGVEWTHTGTLMGSQCSRHCLFYYTTISAP